MDLNDLRHRARRQPRRDRRAGHPHAARDGHPLGRGVQRRRRRRPPRRRGRRRRQHRTRGRPAELPQHRRGGRGGPAHRRAGGAPRLRIPLGERAIRGGAAGGGHRVHRATGRGDPDHGRQDRREGGGVGVRCAGRSRCLAPRSHRRRPDRRRRRGRLSGSGEAVGRRRRQGHAGRARAVGLGRPH